MKEILVDLRDVTIFASDNMRNYRYYKNNIVLEHVNLQVSSGELVYLIGKVGSGKSSLLKTLYAEYPLYRGEARVGDFNLKELRYRDISKLRRSMGLVFQDLQLLPDRTVYENLKFFLKAIGWRNLPSINERIDKVLSMVGLRGKAHSYPYELSGGEQQRISISRALLNRPKIFIADEPTVNLDPICTEEIMQILYNIASNGCAVIIATHNINILEDFPGRVLMFDSQSINEIDIDYNNDTEFNNELSNNVNFEGNFGANNRFNSGFNSNNNGYVNENRRRNVDMNGGVNLNFNRDRDGNLEENYNPNNNFNSDYETDYNYDYNSDETDTQWK